MSEREWERLRREATRAGSHALLSDAFDALKAEHEKLRVMAAEVVKVSHDPEYQFEGGPLFGAIDKLSEFLAEGRP